MFKNDAQKIKLAFYNLLSNSIQYAAPNSQITVHVSFADPEAVSISVRNLIETKS